MSRCIHHLDLCPDCGGLAITELTNMADLGITSITINLVDGPPIIADPERSYLGPVESCPNEEPDADRSPRR